MRIWGEVSYAGQPVEEGAILLSPIEDTGGHATGATIRQGKYEVAAADGPLAGGTYRVDITGLRWNGQIKTPHGMAPVRSQYIPAAYNRQSTLRLEVSSEPSENKHDFRLTD